MAKAPPSAPAQLQPPSPAPPALKDLAAAGQGELTDLGHAAADLVGARALDNLKLALGDAWQDKLSPSERQLAVDMLNDAAGLSLTSVITGQALEDEWAQIWAQTAGIASIEPDRMKHYLETAVGRAALGGLTSLVSKVGPFLI